MRLCIFCVHIETSSLWAEFVNNNRCISVRSVFEEGGSRENLLLLSTVCENIYLEAKWLKNYQSPNLLNFHAYHLILWFFCANSSFLHRLIVKFSLVLGLFLNYNYDAYRWPSEDRPDLSRELFVVSNFINCITVWK